VAGGRWERSCYVSDRKVPAFRGDELQFVCTRAKPLRGALAEAPAGTVAHFAAVCKLHIGNGYVHDSRVFTAEVARDGAFLFDDVPAELHSSRISFVAPPGSEWQPPLFASEKGRQLPSELEPQPDGQAAVEFSALDLVVVDPMGGPARGAVAFISCADRQGILVRDSLVRVALDERGSARMRLVPGRWVVVVMTEAGFRGQELQMDRRNQQAKVSLAPLGSMTVEFVDLAGKAVAGAGVELSGTTTLGTNDPVGSIMQGLATRARLRWRLLRTNRQGVVKIPFVPVEGVEQRVQLRWSGGASGKFALEDGAEVTITAAPRGAGR
jgi:hypothetical protein